MYFPVAKDLRYPLHFTMQNMTDTDDLLGLNISLKASPVITFDKGTPVEAIHGEAGRFQLLADATLQYTSFSRVLNSFLAGQRFDLSEGLFAKQIVVRNVVVSSHRSNAILLKVNFTGSFTGTLTFSGIPVYNEETESIVLLHLHYDLQTGNLLLKGAKLLFASRIEKELKKAARFPVNPLLEKIQMAINENLNKEWATGIKGAGEVKDLRVLRLQAIPEHLLLQVVCEGSLQITLSGLSLNLKR